MTNGVLPLLNILDGWNNRWSTKCPIYSTLASGDLSKRLGQLLIHRTHYGDSGNDEPEKLRVGDQFVTDPFAKGIIILTEIIIRDRAEASIRICFENTMVAIPKHIAPIRS